VSARIVCDASALVALLLDNGSDGQWATETITGADIAAPSLVEFESAKIGAMLVTLDGRISGAPGLRCTIKTPPASGS
jgi:hypothetical protein